MKKYLSYLIVGLTLTTATGFVTGCANNKKETNQDRKSSQSSKEEKKLRVGMTKAEVRDTLGGNPRRVTTDSNGHETWFYHTNEGEGWIPFNYGYTPKTATVHFNGNGRVSSYSYDK